MTETQITRWEIRPWYDTFYPSWIERKYVLQRLKKDTDNHSKSSWWTDVEGSGTPLCFYRVKLSHD